MIEGRDLSKLSTDEGAVVFGLLVVAGCVPLVGDGFRIFNLLKVDDVAVCSRIIDDCRVSCNLRIDDGWIVCNLSVVDGATSAPLLYGTDVG